MAGVLAGQAALVTGASSGIGEAIAVALATAGAKVAVSARRADRLAALVKKIEAAGGEAFAIPGDAAVEAQAYAAVAQTISKFGKIDILINSAGILQSGGIETCNLDEYRRVMDVNLMGTVYTCKAALPAMKAQGGGDIVNISSQVARTAAPPFNAYAASKHALNAMSESLRREVCGDKIRVCVVMPGATATEVADSVSDPNVRTAMQAWVNKEGAVLPSEVADTVVFMLAMPKRVNIDLISIKPTIEGGL
jgi:NADP-dependent 3-hydroxy acid dehydrogenase YdfG